MDGEYILNRCAIFFDKTLRALTNEKNMTNPQNKVEPQSRAYMLAIFTIHSFIYV